jgi:hypothetical protein
MPLPAAGQARLIRELRLNVAVVRGTFQHNFIGIRLSTVKSIDAAVILGRDRSSRLDELTIPPEEYGMELLCFSPSLPNTLCSLLHAKPGALHGPD